MRSLFVPLALLLLACDLSSSGLGDVEGPSDDAAGQIQRGGNKPNAAAGGTVVGGAGGASGPMNAGGAAGATSTPAMLPGSTADAGVAAPAAPAPGSPNAPEPTPSSPAAPTTPVTPAPTTPVPPAPTTPAPPPTATGELRVKDVNVGTLRATRIVARSVRVRSADVARVIEPKDVSWEAERGDGDVKQEDLTVTTLYAKDVRADHLVADEVVAKEYVVDDK